MHIPHYTSPLLPRSMFLHTKSILFYRPTSCNWRIQKRQFPRRAHDPKNSPAPAKSRTAELKSKSYKRGAFFPQNFFFFLFSTLSGSGLVHCDPYGAGNANDYQEWVSILLGLVDRAHYLDVTCELVLWVNSHSLIPQPTTHRRSPTPGSKELIWVSSDSPSA